MKDFSESAIDVALEIVATTIVMVISRLIANRIVKKIEERTSN